jgi:asparagine synthase (glutamine-hydrolysing)
MCGINGIIRIKDQEKAKQAISRMNLCVKHRGPDDDGEYSDDFLSLGHRRLSIIDLTASGHQPMFSPDGSIVVVFNGEIYNFKELKSKISGYQFLTNSDTEVIIAAYLKWGISFVEQLDGMFAIALYDKREKAIWLIRDRLGVKPIYYYESPNGEIYFSSEIRGIIAGAGIKAQLNEEAVQDYFTYQTVTGQSTLIKDIKMLNAGSFARINNQSFEVKAYWELSNQPKKDIDYETAVKHTRELIFKAVEKRMMADVPLGAFLSGGIDSSAIVAAMAECGVKPNTFNVNFSEGKFSEAEYAQMIAKKFNTNHTEINLKPEYFLGLLPTAVSALDHPSIDGLNTYVVSKATKEAGISVALSGVGGDEWFAGYPVFHRVHQDKLKKIRMIPKWIRKPLASGLKAFSNNEGLTKKFELLGSDLNFNDLHQAERKLFTNSQINKLLNKGSIQVNANVKSIKDISDLSIAEWEYYLLPVLLRDTDQMGMAHSLEIREPFLDYKLIEYVLSLPESFKFGAKPKQLLVSAMGDLLPDEIVSRPKMGFVLPYEVWMKNDLKPYVKKGLEILKSNTFFNGKGIEELEESYFTNRRHIKWNMIWSLAVLGHWINNNHIE